MRKPLILVTNDDGIMAPGIKALVEEAKNFGTVVVVAPDSPQSGQGHAITINNPLRLKKIFPFEGVESYACSGTPVDCVKLAKNVILKDQKIDFCVSGINHGSNSSINVIYSGTMSAAMEASLEGIDSVGFSLLDYDFLADFTASRRVVSNILRKMMERQRKEVTLLNVNIPNLPPEKIKGYRVCRQADGNWQEDFQEGVDPQGRKYYWLKGEFVNFDQGDDTDIWALENGYVSIVPTGHDLTVHRRIQELGFLSNEGLNM